MVDAALKTFSVVVLALAISGSASHGQQTGGARIALRAAQILELFDATPKRVAFRIDLDATPTCDGAAPSYSFLIDADRTKTTGGKTRAFAELGIDAQVEIRCDATSKKFVSAAGEVVVTAAIGGSAARLEVVTPLAALPSQTFYWIAVAREGPRYVRLPEAGRFEAWRTVDRWLH